MAVQYVSTTNYNSVAQWAATTAYSLNQLVRQQTGVGSGSARVFKCTQAGTSGSTQPTWLTTAAATTTDNTVKWQEVTGSSWTQPHFIIQNALALGWAGAGDNIYVDSTQSETFSSTNGTYTSPSGLQNTRTLLISVNAAGSVPPVPADIQAGATITLTGASAFILNFSNNFYVEGFTIVGNASTSEINFSSAQGSNQYWKNCTFQMGVSSTGSGWFAASNTLASKVVWDNCTVQFANATQSIIVEISSQFRWINTPSAIQGATMPATLFTAGTSSAGIINLNGVDLSAFTGNIISSSGAWGQYLTLENCKLNASVTLINPASGLPDSQWIQTVNCDSANTNYNNFWGRIAGNITTDTANHRSAGATDGTTAVSHKYVSNTAASNSYSAPIHDLWGPEIFLWNTRTGASRTATIEIVNDGTTLTNADIWLELEYISSSTSTLSTVANTLPATPLTATSNLSTSTVTWTTSGITTPVKQNVQVTFTPQKTGLIRARIHLAKSSKTVWVDPFITLT